MTVASQPRASLRGERAPRDPSTRDPERTPSGSPRDSRRTVVAAFLGTALEWYDFFLFGTTAAIVFAPLFFPGTDPLVSTVGAFLSFSAALLARPVGAVIFGHVGDSLAGAVATARIIRREEAAVA